MPDDHTSVPEAGDSIDPAAFEQLLEMDDDEEERDFSKGIVLGFLDQAKETFSKMAQDLEEKDLADLSKLGHFLKGSSATLGLRHIRDSCERIQHLGSGQDETGNRPKPAQECLDAIELELKALRTEFVKVERAMKAFYHVN